MPLLMYRLSFGALLALATLLWLAPEAWACTTCDPAVQEGIFGHRFVPRLLAILLPLVLGGFAVGMVTKELIRRLELRSFQQLKVGSVVVAGTFLGLGLGGFLDGIWLHQILQVHQMISNIVPPEQSVVAKNINMFWDGVFHMGAWILTFIGMLYFWGAARQTTVRYSTPALLASLLYGWGAFNILDSLGNHFIFRYHNVIERSPRPWLWNVLFLLVGIAQVAIGWLIIRHDVRKGKKHLPQPGVKG